MTRAAKAEMIIAADDQTKVAFDRVQNRMNALGAQAKRAAFGVAAVTGAMAAGTAMAIRHADSIAKNARAAGLGAETYQELAFAASQAGVEQGQLDAALVRFTKRLGLADQGTGAAAKAYKELGISTRTASGEMRASEDVIREVADRISTMGSEAERTAYTTQFFGDDAARLRLLLEDGSVALDSYAAEARSLGMVLDSDLLRQAEAAGDEMDKMTRVAKAQAVVLASNLFPAVIGIGNAFAAAIPHVRTFFDLMNDQTSLGLASEMNAVDIRIGEIRDKLADVGSGFKGDQSAGPGGFLGTTADTLRQRLDPDKLKAELNDLLAQREQLAAEFDRMFNSRQIDQGNLQGNAMALPEGGGGSIPGIGDPEANVERTRAMFDRLHEQRLQAEERAVELEQLRRERQLEDLEAERIRLEEQGLFKQDMEAEFREARENAIAASEARITSIKEREAKKQAQREEQLQRQVTEYRKQAGAMAWNIAKTLASGSKEAQMAIFAVEKAVAVGRILVRGHEAAWLAQATIPPPAGQALAAQILAGSRISAGLVAAQGLAQGVAQFGGSSGGGGSGGSFGGSIGSESRPTPTLPNPADQVRERDQNAASVTVRLEVGSDDGDEISSAIARRLRVLTDDGDMVMIGPDSRQAMEIRGR